MPFRSMTVVRSSRRVNARAFGGPITLGGLTQCDPFGIPSTSHWTGAAIIVPCSRTLGLIDAYEFVVQPRLAGHGPTLFAGLSKHIDVKLVSRLEFSSGAVAMWYAPRR